MNDNIILFDTLSSIIRIDLYLNELILKMHRIWIHRIECYLNIVIMFYLYLKKYILCMSLNK